MKRIAIITGASSGMGREFAKRIDRCLLDELWLIGLNEKELETTAGMCRTKCQILKLDLTKQKSFDTLEEQLKDNIKVEWLINASGYGKFGRYDEIKLESTLNMIDLNVRALVHMTELIIPYMQKGGRIVQFGSVAGFQPVPYISTYGATKAFVISYSRALREELKPKGISVTCVSPYWTKTNFFKRATEPKNNVISNYIVMYDPVKVIDKAFKDARNRKALSIYGFIARWQTRLVKLVPTSFTIWVWKKQQKFDKKYKR